MVAVEATITGCISRPPMQKKNLLQPYACHARKPSKFPLRVGGAKQEAYGIWPYTHAHLPYDINWRIRVNYYRSVLVNYYRIL